MDKKIRWVYLGIGTVAMLFAGIIYAWSILKVPFAAQFNWGASALALNFTITMCFFCLGGLAGARISKAKGSRCAIITSAVLSALGFLLTSRLSGESVGLLYISYGIIAGTGIGIAYNAIISLVNMWFPDKKGVCSGCLMMGFGTSALLLGNLATALMDLPAIGWRTTYVILGLALGVVLLVSGLLLKAPDTALMQNNSVVNTVQADTKSDFDTSQMLHSRNFWLAFLFIVAMTAVGSSVISFARDLALSTGATVTLATTLVGVLSVFNGLGRILTGGLFDRIGQQKTMLVANVTTIGAAAIILLAVLTSSLPFCILGLCLTGLSYGSCPTISSTFTINTFGPKYFSGNLAVMNFNIMFGSFIATLSNSLLTSTGGYTVPFVMLLALTLAALVLNINIRHK